MGSKSAIDGYPAERSVTVYKMKTLSAGVAAALVMVAAGVAQMPPGPGGPAGSGSFPGDGLTGIQAKVRASDEEWKVIGPKIRTVMAARWASEARLDLASISMMSSQAGGFGPGDGAFDFAGMFGNDSFEGPGRLNRGGFMGPGGFGNGGGFDPNTFGGGMPGFGRGGPGGRGGFGPGGFDPNTFGGGMPEFGRGGPGGGGGFGPGGFPSAFGQGMPGFGGGGPGGFDPGTFGSGMQGFGMPGFGPGDPVTQALMELHTVVNDSNATMEQIEDKIAAARTVRQKAQAELAAARKDLLELLTLDQEAVLVVLGYLD
jgi:hypothetical protein